MADSGGFPVPTFEQGRQIVVGEWISGYGAGSNTASDTVDGLVIDIITRIRTIHFERLNAVHNARLFNCADELNLDALLALFGRNHVRLQESGSTVELLLYGALGAVIPKGAQASTLEEGIIYELDAAETVPQSVFAVFVFASAPSGTNAKITIDGVDYDPIIGITGSGLAIAQAVAGELPPAGDAQVSEFWAPFEDASGNGVLVVQMTAKFAFSATSNNAPSFAWNGEKGFATSFEVGEVPGEQFTIVRIGTPLPGWEGVVNLVGASLGRLTETNGLYRIRHKQILGQNGVSTPLAMRAFLHTLPGVQSLRIYENKTIANPDAFGLPSHSFEVVIDGGDGDAIAKNIYILHPLGIETYGTEARIVRHRDDQDRIISFSRPVDRFAWIDVELTPGEGFPSEPTADISADVTARILAWGNSLLEGRDMYLDGVRQVIGVPGTETIDVKFGTTAAANDPKPPMSPINVWVQRREITRHAETRILVTVL